MPFICLTRTDIPPAALQVLDLRPNTSQRSLIYEPPGQTKYVSFRPQNDNIITVAPGAILTESDFRGLAAYLIDNVEDTPNGDALTAAQANTIAANIIANLLDAAGAATTATINAEIAAVVAGSGIGLGNSTATLEGFLRVLSGDEYFLPALSVVDTDGSTFNTAVSGYFSEDKPTTDQRMREVRRTYSTGSLQISLGEGHLAGFTDANFEYLGTAGRAVVVYDDDGTVLG
jgi:hypothetical protein